MKVNLIDSKDDNHHLQGHTKKSYSIKAISMIGLTLLIAVAVAVFIPSQKVEISKDE